MNRRLIRSIIIVMLLGGFLRISPGSLPGKAAPQFSTSTFTDVPTDHWAYYYIDALYDSGITSGCSADPLMYCPEDSVTRAQMAVFLERGMRGSEYTPPTATGAVFDDVSSDHWAAGWIEQLYADGITSGCSLDPLMYCPEETVSRAQMAVFLERAMHWPDPYSPPDGSGTLFGDVSGSHWAVDWIEQLYGDGITSGCSTDPLMYCPEDAVTRAQMAVFLVRAFDLPTLIPSIPETTEVLTEDTTAYLTSVSEDGSTFTFSQTTPELDELSVGDVMVGGVAEKAPYGFLRIVTGVSTVGGEVIVETKAATLEEAIETGKVQLSYTLTPGEIENSMQMKGVGLATSPQAAMEQIFKYTLDDVVLCDLDGDLSTTNDQVTANGGIELEMGFDFEMVVRSFHLEELEFTSTAVETAELQIDADIEMPIVQEEKEIARHYFAPITVPIPPLIFPVVITPVMTINVGVDGSVHAAMSTSVTQQATLTAGIMYSGDEWGPVSEFSNDFEFNPPVVSASMGMRGYSGAQVALMLYGVVGPHGEIDAYLELEADITATPWWTLYGGLEALAGVEIEIFSHTLASYEVTMIDYRIVIAQADTATSTSTPTATQTTTATSTSTSTATQTPTSTGTPTTTPTSTETPTETPTSTPASDPITVHLNLGNLDPTLDPAKLGSGSNSYTPSYFVVNQCYLGLFSLDDETGEPVPQLAADWSANAEATEFTITLRDDAFWTDGVPVTSADVRYGIMRSLAPDTGSPLAYLLFDIENAEAYNDGSLTDPGEVGISVIDSSHVKFELNQSASYFLSILGSPVAKPLSEAMISAHPSDWMEPEHIVTNGPYRIESWDHGNSMTLHKNMDFYGADSVQISIVEFSMVDEQTAWDMYQIGNLDSVLVPLDQWNSALSNPDLASQLHWAPRGGTYYYGFNTSKAPFDNVLVRKAFIAAIDREGIRRDLLQHPIEPALTFTSPSVFGHVDGAVEGVGIPYDPLQAQMWLAEAGFPGGEGMPSITLAFNSNPVGHQAIAEYIQQSWLANLGVDVNLIGHDWYTYMELLESDPPQIWRMGWSAIFNDAYDFLHISVLDIADFYGGWSSSPYTDLMVQASTEVDGLARSTLYKQAEEILVEIDAVNVPLYYYGNGFATKLTLERNYGMSGYGGNIGDWRITAEP